MKEIVSVRPCIEFQYPEFSGCYALLSDGVVTYVGKSLNVLQRLYMHRNRLKRVMAGKNDYSSQSRVLRSWDSVRIYPCPTRELDQLERELILLYRPEGNVQVPRVWKTIDMAALIARAKVTDHELGQWKRDVTRTYSPKPSRSYRRVA